MPYVGTGEYRVFGPEGVIETDPVHTCVAVLLYDTDQELRGMSHSPEPEGQNPEYADYAVREMIGGLEERGSMVGDLEATLVGGSRDPANPSSNLGRENVASAKKVLEEFGVPIEEQYILGNIPREVKFLASGEVNVWTKQRKREIY